MMIEAAGQLRETLALVAPGTVLRDGLERILRGRTGAIIVLGFDPVVEAISSGGFHLDVELSAARLRELAKMDGGVVVDMDTARIRRANVQLLPNASIQTSETGMRHRTAERVARQTGYPVISVSQSMRIISLYVDGKRHVLEPSESILASANQALSALERYKARLDQTSAGLDSLEIEDLVTVRDVTSVLQLMEMVRRISDDIDSYVLELGTDGRLLALQVEELTRGLLAEHGFLLEDYLPEGLDTATVDARLKWVGSPALLDLAMVARSMGLGGIDGQDLDAQVSPRGLRILSKIPRLPVVTARAVVEQWGSLQGVLGATIEELEAVEGVGAQRARTLRDGLVTEYTWPALEEAIAELGPDARFHESFPAVGVSSNGRVVWVDGGRRVAEAHPVPPQGTRVFHEDYVLVGSQTMCATSDIADNVTIAWVDGPSAASSTRRPPPWA